MAPDMGTFEAFYASPTQHPFLLWAAAGAALIYCATRTNLDATVRRYCFALVVLSGLDAWMSSAHIYGIGALEGMAASVVPLFFVLAGDTRFLIVAVAGSPGGKLEINGRVAALAAGLTVLVPVTTQVILRSLPESMNHARMMFFIYEVLFVLLTLTLLRVHENVRTNPWVQRVAHFVVIYYGLWATADLIILTTGADIGFAVRVLPNVLYYGGLIAVMAWSAEKASEESH